MPLFHQTLAIGLVLSILLSERSSLSSAGMIGPGYFAFFLTDPVRLGVVILATGLTFASERLLSRAVILFGRRLLAVDMLLSFLFTALCQGLALYYLPHQAFVLDPLAYFIPALLVIFIGANGALSTAYSLALLTAATRAILLLGVRVHWLS